MNRYHATMTCACDCHDICSCDLTLSLRRWRCFRHVDGAHCHDCENQ